MSTLFRLISYIWAGFIGCAALAILIGRGQPPPARIQLLHLSDCSPPCWIGITPRQTQDADASRSLSDVFGVPRMNADSMGGEYGLFRILPLSDAVNSDDIMPIQFQVNQGIVDEIRIPALFGNGVPEVEMPLLGDMVNLLGKPACVDPSPYIFGGWSLIY
jgi:hypothetical protein